MSKSDDTKRAAEALDTLAREFTKHSGPHSSDKERETFARDLHAGALRYARAYYAEAREYGLIPEYGPTQHEPAPAPIVIPVSEIRIGDVLVAWRLDEESSWSKIGMRGDMRVVELLPQQEAITASKDTVKLAGYQWQVRRAS